MLLGERDFSLLLGDIEEGGAMQLHHVGRGGHQPRLLGGQGQQLHVGCVEHQPHLGGQSQ